jgi:hypothetical protein
VSVAISTGWKVPMGAYGEKILSSKYKKGFIRYDVCPYDDHRNIIPKGDVTPCEGTFSREKCCKHIVEFIASRRAAKKIKHQKFAERCKTEQGALIDYLKAQAKRLGDNAEAADIKHARKMPGRSAPTEPTNG